MEPLRTEQSQKGQNKGLWRELLLIAHEYSCPSKGISYYRLAIVRAISVLRLSFDMKS